MIGEVSDKSELTKTLMDIFEEKGTRQILDLPAMDRLSVAEAYEINYNYCIITRDAINQKVRVSIVYECCICAGSNGTILRNINMWNSTVSACSSM